MKKLYAIHMPDFYGTGFFDASGKLITFIHENDACWRSEYFGPIIEYFGGQVQWLKSISNSDMGIEDDEPWEHLAMLAKLVCERIPSAYMGEL